MLDIIHDSSTPKPEAMLVSEVWDFKNWIASEFLGKLKGHTKHHVYRFTRGSTQRAEMHYKHLSSDGWEPEGAGVCVLSVSLFLFVYGYVYVCNVFARYTYILELGPNNPPEGVLRVRL